MKKYEIKTSFVSHEGPKASAKKTGNTSFIINSVCNTMNWEPVLIQRILIGFESILENRLLYL